MSDKLIYIPEPPFELSGPYECPRCEGYVMLDAEHAKEVDLLVCPYCQSNWPNFEEDLA